MEEELCFSNRFEEGYDLYDSKYEAYTPSTPSTSCNSTLVFPSVSKSQANLSTPPPHTSAVSGSKTLSGRSPLSDLLDLPKNVLDTKQKTGRARVLTECLHLLKEKEEKKNKYNLKRKRRKQERKLKKQQREEEQKRKADEKAQNATERQALKAKKEAAKAEKEVARIE